MKRSDCNNLLKARIDFSTGKYAFGTKDDSETYFSRQGCEICPDGLAGDISEVTYLLTENEGRAVYEADLCNGCLVSLVNADDSDLDYYCDDENEPALTPDQASAEVIAEKADKPTAVDIKLRKDLTDLLLGLVCYQNYSIYVNGETSERTIDEIYDWFIVQTNDDEKIEIKAYLAENETAKIMEFLANYFDFSFLTESYENDPFNPTDK